LNKVDSEIWLFVGQPTFNPVKFKVIVVVVVSVATSLIRVLNLTESKMSNSAHFLLK